VLSVILPDGGSAQHRDELDLIHVRLNVSGSTISCRCVDLKFGAPNCPYTARFQQPPPPLTSGDVPILVRVGQVDAQQIHILRTKALQAALIALGNEVDTMPLLVELGGDEDLLTGNCRGAGPFDVALVAGFERKSQARFSGLVVHRRGSETRTRRPGTVAQGNRGCTGRYQA
jgi:hypothetical protein